MQCNALNFLPSGIQLVGVALLRCHPCGNPGWPGFAPLGGDLFCIMDSVLVLESTSVAGTDTSGIYALLALLCKARTSANTQ
eukprot:177663-Amphidinium_carterae.1